MLVWPSALFFSKRSLSLVSILLNWSDPGFDVPQWPHCLSLLTGSYWLRLRRCQSCLSASGGRYCSLRRSRGCYQPSADCPGAWLSSPTRPAPRVNYCRSFCYISALNLSDYSSAPLALINRFQFLSLRLKGSSAIWSLCMPIWTLVSVTFQLFLLSCLRHVSSLAIWSISCASCGGVALVDQPLASHWFVAAQLGKD